MTKVYITMIKLAVVMSKIYCVQCTCNYQMLSAFENTLKDLLKRRKLKGYLFAILKRFFNSDSNKNPHFTLINLFGVQN